MRLSLPYCKRVVLDGGIDFLMRHYGIYILPFGESYRGWLCPKFLSSSLLVNAYLGFKRRPIAW